MLYSDLEPILIRGKVGLLPRYKGYFHWDYAKKCMYMKNGDYIKYDLDEEKKRTAWFDII